MSTLRDRVVLREFLYRRDDLVAQFLEGLEGGEYEEERIKEQATRAAGGGASAGVGAFKANADLRKDGTSETELTMRQTPASRFNRLHSLLDQNDTIQPLESLDDAIWDSLRRNEVVEVEAVLTLAPGVATMNQVAGLGALLPLIGKISSLPDEMLPDDLTVLMRPG